jgi:hypothetical protein
MRERCVPVQVVTSANGVKRELSIASFMEMKRFIARMEPLAWKVQERGKENATAMWQMLPASFLGGDVTTLLLPIVRKMTKCRGLIFVQIKALVWKKFQMDTSKYEIMQAPCHTICMIISLVDFNLVSLWFTDMFAFF